MSTGHLWGRNGEFCVVVGCGTRTAGILTYCYTAERSKVNAVPRERPHGRLMSKFSSASVAGNHTGGPGTCPASSSNGGTSQRLGAVQGVTIDPRRREQQRQRQFRRAGAPWTIGDHATRTLLPAAKCTTSSQRPSTVPHNRKSTL